MEQFSANVLLDILIFCILSIAIAIPIYSYIRRTHPDLTWHQEGLVNTSPLGRLDLLGISLASLVFTSNLVILYFNPNIDTSQVAKLSNIELFTSNLIAQLIPVGIACLFLIPRTDVLELFGLKGINISRILVYGILGVIAVYISVILASLAVTPFLVNMLGEPELQAPVQMIIEAKKNNPSLLIYLVVLAVVVAPICEEFVFRGYIYATLKRFSCRYLAIFISALLFSIVHTSIWALIPLFIVGVGLAIIYEKSGSLWAPILTHALFNGLNTAALILTN